MTIKLVPLFQYYVRTPVAVYGPYQQLSVVRGVATRLRQGGVEETVIEKYALTLVASTDDTGEEFTPVRPADP